VLSAVLPVKRVKSICTFGLLRDVADALKVLLESVGGTASLELRLAT
jgi:hypothetical protein